MTQAQKDAVISMLKVAASSGGRGESAWLHKGAHEVGWMLKADRVTKKQVDELLEGFGKGLERIAEKFAGKGGEELCEEVKKLAKELEGRGSAND